MRRVLAAAEKARWLYRLPLRDRLMLVNAVVLLLVVRLLLVPLSFPHVTRALTFLSRAGRRRRSANGRYIRRVTWAVGAAARRIFPKRPCLPQALVTQLLLNRRGFDTELRIGVKKNDAGSLIAHAWLERDGYVVIGGSDAPSTYAPLRALT